MLQYLFYIAHKTSIICMLGTKNIALSSYGVIPPFHFNAQCTCRCWHLKACWYKLLDNRQLLVLSKIEIVNVTTIGNTSVPKLHSFFILEDGSCTFPEYLVGNWTSAERGSLSITTDSIYNYKVFIPSSDPNNPFIAYYNFTCLTQVGSNRYTIK